MRRSAGERPFIICHIFASIDGRIEGRYMVDTAAAASRGAYARLQAGYAADAIAYGAVTTKGFIGSRRPALVSGATVPAGDYVAETGAAPYYISIDPAGELAWESGTMRRPGRPDAHVIELLTEGTPAPYRSYLREHGVSYVIAGTGELDLAHAARTLRARFGIERLLVCGGGMTDAAFLAAGIIDELSIVVAPVASAERGVATIFDAASFAPVHMPHAFTLDRVERVDGDGVHLVYRRA